MILVVSPHNRSVSELSISFRVCCEGLLQYSKRFKSKKPTVRIRLTWNSIGWYQISICTIAWSWIFRFSSRGTYWNLWIVAQPSVLMRLSWNLVGSYETLVRTILWSRMFDFLPGGAVGAPLLEYLNRITAYNSHATELKLCGMIKTSVRTVVRRRIFRFALVGIVGACLLKHLNRITSHSITPIEMKLGRMIPEYPHTFSNRFTAYSIYPNWVYETWYDYTKLSICTISKSRIF